MADKVRHRASSVALVVAVLALTGCGGGEGSGGADGSAATSIAVSADEYSFDPPEVTAAGDQDVDVTLENAGQLQHQWVVLSSGTGIASEEGFSEDLVEFQIEADPGQDGSESMNLPAGDYQVICAVPGHFDAGMEGALTLE